jgi:hypothetical protein
MERQFTEQEIKAIYEAEPALRKLGLIVYEADADSPDDVAHNTNQIVAWFRQHPEVSLTVTTVLKLAEQLRPSLKWMSKAQIRYIEVYENGLTESQKNQFGQFWNMSSTKKALVQIGDAGFENCVALIEFARGRDFSISTFNLALGNLSAQGKLHLAPVHQPQRPGHAMEPGESFMKKEPAKPEYVGGRKNHSLDTPKPAQPTPDNTPDAWSRIIAGQLADGTHGQQQASRELYTRLSAEGLSPRQISAELSKLQRSYQRLFSSTAV